MPRTKEDIKFEERQARLADFLRGGRFFDEPADEWDMARTMLLAQELLDAGEYALTLICSLSTEDFAAGGDRPARDRLADVIAKAKGGVSIRDSVVARCAIDVREAIRLNQARTL
jgi:hypothetical protein